MPNIRGPELLILVLVVVLLFGAKRLPDAARSVGRSLRIFKAETKGLVDGEAAPDTTATTTAAAASAAPAALPPAAQAPIADSQPRAPDGRCRAATTPWRRRLTQPRPPCSRSPPARRERAARARRNQGPQPTTPRRPCRCGSTWASCAPGW